MDNHEQVNKKRRVHWVALVVALLATGVMSVSVYSALGGFSAAIVNNGNSFSSGTLLLEEQVNGGTPCLSSPDVAGGITTNVNSSCTADDYGTAGNPGYAPSTVVSNTVVLTNTGTLTAPSMTLTPSTTCTVTGNPPGTGPNALSTGSDTTGFCGKVDVQIQLGTGATASCLYGGTAGSPCPTTLSNTYTLATLAANGPITLGTNIAPNSPITVVINLELDPSATNADQGLTATLPITWSMP